MRITRNRAIALVAVALLAVVVLAAVAPGGVTRFDGRRADAPSWAAACWNREPRTDRDLLARCARVSGRVLWVRRQGREGSSKAEMLISSNFGLVVSKMSPYVGRRVPAVGHYVHIVGPLVQSKTGLDEVEFFAEL